MRWRKVCVKYYEHCVLCCGACGRIGRHTQSSVSVHKWVYNLCLRQDLFATFRMKWNVVHSRAMLGPCRAFVLLNVTSFVCWPDGFEDEVDLCASESTSPHCTDSVPLPHKHAHDVNLIIVKFRCASLYLAIGVFRVRKAKVYSAAILSFDQYKFKWAIVKCTYWCEPAKHRSRCWNNWVIQMAREESMLWVYKTELTIAGLS